MPAYLTDEEKAKLYRQRIIRGAETHRRLWMTKADQRFSRYENEASIESFTQEGHRINTPHGTSIIDSMFSSLTAVEVVPVINLKGHGSYEMAKLVEAALQHVWGEAKVPRRSAYSIKDTLIAGLGWGKVGYDYAAHTEKQPKPREMIRNEVKAIFQQARAEGRPLSDLKPEMVAAAIEPEHELRVVDRDRITFDYIPWDKVIYDPSARNVEDWRWIAQITEMPVEEVIYREEYRDYLKQRRSLKLLDQLKPDTEINKIFRPDPEAAGTPDEDRIRILEFWNLVSGTVCHLPFTGGDFLLYETENPFFFNEDFEDRSPYVPLILRDNPKSVRGISDMELIIPSLDELNRHRSALLNYLERAVPKIVAPLGVVTEAGKNALQSPDPDVVELDQGHTAQEIDIIKYPPLPSETYALIERVENDLREATGVSEIMRGLFPDRKRTATETTEVVAASAARQAEKRTLLEDFYSKIAKRMVQLMQTYWDEPRVSRMADLEGDIVWEWSAADITAEFDIDIQLAPKQYRGPVEREERALRFTEVLGALPDTIIDHSQLIIWAARESGISMQELRLFVKSLQEKQATEQAALQKTAAEAQAAEGTVPDPAMVPGPAGAAELAGLANPGEVPVEIGGQPNPVEEAVAMVEGMTGPTDFIPGA